MSQLRVRVEQGVGWVEFENPPYHFMTAAMVVELDRLLASWERDPSVRAIVLTGGTGGGFVTHYSVDEIAAGNAQKAAVPRFLRPSVVRYLDALFGVCRLLGPVPLLGRALDAALSLGPTRGVVELNRVHRVFARIGRMDKAVIAAIGGDCMGAGCELALACDVRLMARGDHRIGLTEVLGGIIPALGGTQRLSRLVGPGRALEMILEGRLLEAGEALAIGLVHEAVDADRLVDRARERAAALGRRPPFAVGAAKRAVREGMDRTLADGLELEKRLFVRTTFTPEAIEGGDAYLAQLRAGKRPRAIFEALRNGDGPQG